jgi:hypothetical protein
MLNPRFTHALSVFSSGYVKRWMENNYDRLMMTAPGRRLMDLDQKTRYAIEAVLYAVMVAGEQALPDGSAVQWLIKEVLLDAPPEVAKRLVNGFRDDYVHQSAHAPSSVVRNTDNLLLQLSPDQLKSILTWCATLPPEEMARYREVLLAMSKEQLAVLASLGDSERRGFLSLVAPGPQRKDRCERSPELQGRIDAARQRIQEEHRLLRERQARQ